jgi:hypothetical protein
MHHKQKLIMAAKGLVITECLCCVKRTLLCYDAERCD